jgi:hypothetical protein
MRYAAVLISMHKFVFTTWNLPIMLSFRSAGPEAVKKSTGSHGAHFPGDQKCIPTLADCSEGV